MDEDRRRPIAAQLLDNLTLWLFLGGAIGLLYMVWASIEILNHYVGPMVPYTPGAVPVLPPR